MQERLNDNLGRLVLTLKPTNKIMINDITIKLVRSSKNRSDILFISDKEKYQIKVEKLEEHEILIPKLIS